MIKDAGEFTPGNKFDFKTLESSHFLICVDAGKLAATLAELA